MTAERRPAPGQDAKVERYQRAAKAALVARAPAERTAAHNELRAAREAITWEDVS